MRDVVEGTPSVGIFTSLFTRATESVTHWGAVPPCREVVTLEDATSRQWDFEACFSAYQVRGPEGLLPRWPRIKSETVASLVEGGYAIETVAFVFDWDLPKTDGKKTPWNAERVDGFFATVRRAVEIERGTAHSPGYLEHGLACLYATRHGARFLLVPDSPVDIGIHKAKYNYLLGYFARLGLQFDVSCSDWTRLFRLPRVVYDGRASELAFDTIVNWAARIDGDLIPASGPVTRFKDLSAVTDAQDYGQEPEPTVAKELALNTTLHQRLRTVLAKRYLDLYDRIYGNSPIPTKNRNATVFRWVGILCSIIRPMTGFGPEHVFGLLLPTVEQFDQDEREPWESITWEMVTRQWREFDIQFAAVERTGNIRAHAASGLRDQMIAGMREWAPVPEDPAAANSYLLAHAVAYIGQHLYVLGPDGRYSPNSVDSAKLAAKIRELGVDGVIKIDVLTDRGPKPMHSTEILRAYGTQVASVKALIGQFAAYIENVDSPRAALVLPSYGLREGLTPEFNETVDRWLTLLVGGARKDELERWLGLATFVGNPICALSLAGAAGSGKKMIAVGLSECFDPSEIVDAAQALGAFPEGLLHTPIVHVDEGWPYGTGRPADLFRRLTKGDTLHIGRKHRTTVAFCNPVRMILTANNLSLVLSLAKGELTSDDQVAIQQRLLHFDVSPLATTFLREGGRDMTDGWIRRDDGSPGNFTLAKHILHLRQKWAHAVNPDSMLLAEGRLPTQLVNEFRATAGETPAVVETLIDMLNNALSLKRKPMCGFTTGRDAEKPRNTKLYIWVRASDVVDHYNTVVARRLIRPRPLGLKDAATALASISSPARPISRTLEDKRGLGTQRYFRILPARLREVAVGHACPELNKLIDGSPIIPISSASAPGVKSNARA